MDPDAGLACAFLGDLDFGDWAFERWPALSDAVLAEHAPGPGAVGGGQRDVVVASKAVLLGLGAPLPGPVPPVEGSTRCSGHHPGPPVPGAGPPSEPAGPPPAPPVEVASLSTGTVRVTA